MEGVIFILGILGGWFGAYLLFRKKPVIGTLRIDTSDPDSEPYLFLEIDQGYADQLFRSKNVLLRVKRTQK